MQTILKRSTHKSKKPPTIKKTRQVAMEAEKVQPKPKKVTPKPQAEIEIGGDD